MQTEFIITTKNRQIQTDDVSIELRKKTENVETQTTEVDSETAKKMLGMEIECLGKLDDNLEK